ncbi:unnamed protein product [Prorocentrum cordatum]|uniref:DNA-(apurinic or apyrimidinic site) endonuclease n=1 Tax=Prorocentrum cordatum TaxID=2364126 RepID=A0ABN9Y6B6_9DINO|nr:unnamed protein product [Polarella glacialis]
METCLDGRGMPLPKRFRLEGGAAAAAARPGRPRDGAPPGGGYLPRLDRDPASQGVLRLEGGAAAATAGQVALAVGSENSERRCGPAEPPGSGWRAAAAWATSFAVALRLCQHHGQVGDAPPAAGGGERPCGLPAGDGHACRGLRGRGAGLGAEWKVILARSGAYLAAARAPFVIGGDWNCSAQELEAWGWPQRAPGMATLRTGSGSELTYFVASAGRGGEVAGCRRRRHRLPRRSSPRQRPLRRAWHAASTP